MSGVIVGLEFSEALTTARLMGSSDDRRATECLIALEIGALEGVAKATPKS